jgi:hypothetical protein
MCKSFLTLGKSLMFGCVIGLARLIRIQSYGGLPEYPFGTSFYITAHFASPHASFIKDLRRFAQPRDSARRLFSLARVPAILALSALRNRETADALREMRI